MTGARTPQGSQTIPATFIVDKKGVVKFAHPGWYDGDDAKYEKELNTLL